MFTHRAWLWIKIWKRGESGAAERGGGLPSPSLSGARESILWFDQAVIAVLAAVENFYFVSGDIHEVG